MVTDQELIAAMFGRDPEIAKMAKDLYDCLHAAEPQPRAPQHCVECFEGCPKCQPACCSKPPRVR